MWSGAEYYILVVKPLFGSQKIFIFIFFMIIMLNLVYLASFENIEWWKM